MMASMDILDRLRAQEDDLEPFEAVPGAYHWDVGGGWFNNHFFVSDDGTRGFLLSVRDGYDASWAAEVLAAAKLHQSSAIDADPLRVVTGVEFATAPYDALLFIHPRIAKRFAEEDSELSQHIYNVFGIMHFEVPPDLDDTETQGHLRRVDPSNMAREPACFVRAKFGGTTEAESVGHPVIPEGAVLGQAFAMQDNPGGFLEVTNGAGRTVRVEFDGAYRVLVDDESLQIDANDQAIGTWLREFMSDW